MSMKPLRVWKLSLVTYRVQAFNPWSIWKIFLVQHFFLIIFFHFKEQKYFQNFICYATYKIIKGHCLRNFLTEDAIYPKLEQIN